MCKPTAKLAIIVVVASFCLFAPRIAEAKSRFSRSGLKFAKDIQDLLHKGNYTERVGAGAPVYLAAVMEYLAAEVLELAGKGDRKRYKSIWTRNLRGAMKKNRKLKELLSGDLINKVGSGSSSQLSPSMTVQNRIQVVDQVTHDNPTCRS